jgi:hypothetical protein
MLTDGGEVVSYTRWPRFTSQAGFCFAAESFKHMKIKYSTHLKMAM